MARYYTASELSFLVMPSLIYRIGDLGNLTAPCNTNCNCLRSYYYPLCGRDGVQYFSPCFAGCLNYVSNSKPKVMGLLLYPS